MVHKPKETSQSKACTVIPPSVTIQALKRFQRPSQLWRGYTALAARNLPFTAMQFPMFEHLKETIRQYRRDKGTSTGNLAETAMVTAVSAGVAGSVASVITTPVDVVKTRIMLSAAGESSEGKAKEKIENARQQGQSLNKLAKLKSNSRKSGFAVARETIGENGVKGLFRGGILRAGECQKFLFD